MCGALKFEDKIFFAKNRQKSSFPQRDARDQALGLFLISRSM